MNTTETIQKPAYLAQIRHITVEGWLTYGAPDGLIIKVVIKDGKSMDVEIEEQINPYEKFPRTMAKAFWKGAVKKILEVV